MISLHLEIFSEWEVLYEAAESALDEFKSFSRQEEAGTGWLHGKWQLVGSNTGD